jgi:hypothetical protein
MTETRSSAPPFTHKGIRFESWILSEGELPGLSRYVWLSEDGRISCGKHGGWHWVAIDRKYVATRCPSLLAAMKEGIVAMDKMRRVA